MPARRDMLTGRLTFLHRSWGPLEPFDNAFPELLHRAGVYSHLVTDHFHYWEDGGATYHNRYDSYEFVRGQEGDPWKAMVQPHWERLREMYHAAPVHDAAARVFLARTSSTASSSGRRRTFRPCSASRMDSTSSIATAKRTTGCCRSRPSTRTSRSTRRQRFKEPFQTGWNGPIRDWPRYGRVDELPEECEELRANYYAIVSLCDFLLGQLLDYFDAHDLWKDTALVVTTDHGFLLGEHDFWAKNRMNLYEEIVAYPALHSRSPSRAYGRQSRHRRSRKPSTSPPTFLDLLRRRRRRPRCEGARSFRLDGERRARGVLFGYFGGAVNVTDGRYTYHRYPADLATQEIYQYTLMPTHIFDPFSAEELGQASLSGPLPFTKGAKLLKVPVTDRSPMYNVYGPGALLESDDAAIRPATRSRPRATDR